MKATTALLVTMVLAGSALTVCAGVETPVALTVRLYNTSGIPAPELVVARGAAESILPRYRAQCDVPALRTCRCA